MTRAPTTPKGQATRARLLEVAAAELTERGHVEVLSVAARAEVAPSVIYRYFVSKDGLIEAIINAFYDAYDAEVFSPAVATASTWLEAETRRVRREVAFIYEHPLARAAIAGGVHEAAATRVDADRQRSQIATAARNIRYAQRTGQVAQRIDPEMAAAAILGALRAIASAALARDDPPPQEAVADLVIAVGRAALELE